MENELALIIEDDAYLSEIYSAALGKAGFKIEVARDGQAARLQLAALLPRIVVLDLHLPRVSGKDLLKEIRADPRHAQAKVIIVTGDSQAATTVEGEADLVLIKPVSYIQLRDLASRFRSDGTLNTPKPI
jgi:DNA-binding response OmpR family regulator